MEDEADHLTIQIVGANRSRRTQPQPREELEDHTSQVVGVKSQSHNTTTAARGAYRHGELICAATRTLATNPLPEVHVSCWR